MANGRADNGIMAKVGQDAGMHIRWLTFALYPHLWLLIMILMHIWEYEQNFFCDDQINVQPLVLLFVVALSCSWSWSWPFLEPDMEVLLH